MYYINNFNLYDNYYYVACSPIIKSKIYNLGSVNCPSGHINFFNNMAFIITIAIILINMIAAN